MTVNKARYHEADTRYNICEIPAKIGPSSRARIDQQTRSIACLVERTLLIETTGNGAAQFSISPKVPTLAQVLKTDYEEKWKASYAEQKRPCREEETQFSYKGSFQNEPSLGNGTAFLVGKQLILTAAHCICDEISGLVSRVKLTSLRVLFGFQMQSSGEVRTEFESKDVYRIDTVWQVRLTPNEADWALLKLDREVEGREPLSLGMSQAVSLNTSLYMLGHPSGLPLKLTMSGQVQKTNNPHFFETDLDAFAGNSGSPIFENGTGNLIGMLLKGNKDYAVSKSIEDKNAVTIHVSQVSKQEIRELGYEKCHKIASIGFVKTVLSSSFKMAHSHFSGRTKQLANLKSHLTAPSPTTRVQILYGPGGVGKSELAITFANDSIEEFSFIWSISCGTEEERLVGYNGLAKRLEIPLDEKETLPALIINKVHRKLEQNRAKPWLLLFDNLQISPKPPPLPDKGGSILITSYKDLNIQSLPAGAVIATEVLPLEPEEALQFLETVTEKPSNDCRKLLNHVGCYPLVLGQVARYIKHTGIEVEEYLTNLEQSHTVSAAHENSSKNPKMALEAAFGMTLQQLFPPAKQWLFLCSQLNVALIPVSYLKGWLASEDIPEEQAAIIAALEEYALLRYNAQEEVFSLHLEFQRILRSVAPAETMSQAVHLLVNMMNEWDFENTALWGETMKKATIWASHAEPVVEAFMRVPLDTLEMASLLDGLGRWEDANAHYEKALAFHDKVLNIRRAALEENHPAIALSLNNIGGCYYSQGNYTEALKMYGEALKIRRAVLGENHSDVAKSLNGIGICFWNQGNYKEAQRLYEEALEIRKAALGEIHPDVASSLNNIGLCYDSQGNYIKALEVYHEALKIDRAAFGENHPGVATDLNNIGSCYYSQENYNEALRLYGEALNIRKIVLGENHPDVASSLTGIGICYESQKNYNDALKVHGEALNIYRAALGENHPDVATSLYNIANCYYFQRKYNEALKVHSEALKIYRAALGENHPNVATSLHKIKQCQTPLDVYLSEDHFSVESDDEFFEGHFLSLRGDYLSTSLEKGNYYYSQKNYTKALREYREVLKLYRDDLEENHPYIATCLNNIGSCYDFQGNYNQALKFYREALKIYSATFGKNNLDVGGSLENIARCYYFQKNYPDSLKLYVEALKIKRAALGENHPDVAKTLRNIKLCQERLNKGCAIS